MLSKPLDDGAGKDLVNPDTCCADLPNILGAISCPAASREEESRQQNELRTRIKCLASGNWESANICTECGQHWWERFESHGHGENQVYEKVELAALEAKWPALARVGCCSARPDTVGRNASTDEADLHERKELSTLVDSLLRVWSKETERPSRCQLCGQFWIRSSAGDGDESRAVYTKSTLEQLRSRYPDLHLPSGSD